MEEVSGIDTQQKRLRTDFGERALRLSGDRDRRDAFLFRPRRMGGVRARPQAHRGRDAHPPQHPDRLRARRSRRRCRPSSARLLTFVIVGGGATGVEMAGAIAEIARQTLAADFRRIDPRSARIVLVEAGPRVLPTFPPALSDYVHDGADAKRRRGPDRDTRHAVRCAWRRYRWRPHRRRHRHLGRRRVASPAARWLDAEADRAGRVKVGPICRCPGIPRSSSSATPRR